MIGIIVDNELSVDARMLDSKLLRIIKDELTIPNNAHAEAIRRGGETDLPEFFKMYKMDGDYIVMPRGYALQLKTLLREYRHKLWWVDKRVWKRGSPYGLDEFVYRLHQPEAVRQIRIHQQGIYKAPAGSGKTVTVCGLMWETHPTSSLILVDRIHLVDQWITRIKEHIGKVSVGKIGEGNWSVGRITVATVQTLARMIKAGGKKAKQAINLLRQQSIMVLDEMHHVTAETFNTVVGECWARIRIGVSATPDKTGEFDVALNTLGEVFYETTDDELRQLGLLIKPHVQVVYTNFDKPYWGDHNADKHGDCDVPGCKNKAAKHRHKNNYMKLKGELVEDVERNDLIASYIAMEYQQRVQIVITDQTKQIEALLEQMDIGTFFDPKDVYVITGKLTGKKRQEVLRNVEANPNAVLLSTVAGEGLDVAPISCVHLPFPTKNHGKIIQNIGRGTRSLDGKQDVVIYDYVDGSKVFRKQFLKRRWKAYEPKGLKVIIPDDSNNSDIDNDSINSGVFRSSLRSSS